MANGMYEIISRKRDGLELGRGEIAFVIDGYVEGDIPDYQVAAWLMAVYLRGLTDRELADLTDIMLASGGRVALDGVAGKKVDKHSTGGVGDKISFVVAPLLAACGVSVPMLSGRGLGHTGGTLDKLESIPGMNVFLTREKFRAVLDETGMAICGQTDDIVPADKKLYALRDATATVSCLPLIAASIMSKKLALGSDGIVLDVKTGGGAFMRAENDAIDLCRTMAAIGARSGRPVLGIVSNMDQPLGRAVGNGLEIIESIEALKGNGSPDIMAVTHALGWCMLRLAGREMPYQRAVETFAAAIASGRALDVFRSFIAAQGGDDRVCDDYSLLPVSRIKEDLPAPKTGWIEAVDAFEVGMAAIDTGAGRRRKEDVVAHGSGFVFHIKVGDRVEKGQRMITIHSDRPELLPAVCERLQAAIRIGSQPSAKPKMVLHLLDRNGVTPWPY